mmetsp:Transcript_5089/g.8883  ORF Transcript_5089/g.8883 Transcript_5089/m.8883 type:complete len:340 (-) Transcript_5089:144-1163(-)
MYSFSKLTFVHTIGSDIIRCGHVRQNLSGRNWCSSRLTMEIETIKSRVRVFDAHTHLGESLTRHGMKPVPELVDRMFAVENEKIQKAMNPGDHAWDNIELAGCINVNCWSSDQPSKSFERALAFQNKIDNVFGTFGLHPHYAKDWSDAFEKTLRKSLEDRKSVAVGECGLDYYRSLSDPKVQQSVFRKQIRIARELNMPLVVHARDAEEDALDILVDELPSDWNIHLHCYTGTKETALKYLDAFPSLCIGFTGCITFKKSESIRDVVNAVPLDRILLETDAPYMSPVPLRGKACHANMTPLIAAAVSKIKDIPLTEVANVTSENCIRLYRLHQYKDILS